MIWTHVWYCGHWAWRLLTPRQWAAMPSVGKKLALIKSGKIAAAVVCAGSIGLIVPPVLQRAGGDFISASPISQVTDVPEPGTLLIFAGAVAVVAALKRR